MSGSNVNVVSSQSSPANCQAKALTYVAQLAAFAEDQLDMRQFILNGNFTTPQAVYIDNSANGAVFTLFISAVNMEITIQANSQGYFPIPVVSQAEVFDFFSSGGVNVTVVFFNVAMPVGVWKSV